MGKNLSILVSITTDYHLLSFRWWCSCLCTITVLVTSHNHWVAWISFYLAQVGCSCWCCKDIKVQMQGILGLNAQNPGIKCLKMCPLSYAFQPQRAAFRTIMSITGDLGLLCVQIAAAAPPEEQSSQSPIPPCPPHPTRPLQKHFLPPPLHTPPPIQVWGSVLKRSFRSS